MKCKKCSSEIAAENTVCPLCGADQSIDMEKEQRTRVRKSGAIKLVSTVLTIIIFGSDLGLIGVAIAATLCLAFFFEVVTGISLSRRLF